MAVLGTQNVPVKWTVPEYELMLASVYTRLTSAGSFSLVLSLVLSLARLRTKEPPVIIGARDRERGGTIGANDGRRRAVAEAAEEVVVAALALDEVDADGRRELERDVDL